MKGRYSHLYNIPNLITWFRIALIPVFFIVFYLPFQSSHLIAAIIFAIAAITDWLDGYLARNLKQTSALGAFLDPVADKLIVSVALVMLVSELAWLTIPAAIIVAREIIISALREWMAELGKRASVAVSWLGKVKTTVQMIALIVLLYCRRGDSSWILILGYLLLYLAAALTVWSMFLYIRVAWPDLVWSGEEKASFTSINMEDK